jgi:hypothetical protein
MPSQDNFTWAFFLNSVIPVKPRQRRRAGTHWKNVELQAVEGSRGVHNAFCQRPSRSSNGSRIGVASLLVRDDGYGNDLPTTYQRKSADRS